MDCKDELLSTPAAESEGSPGAWPHTGRSAARWSNRPTLSLGCVPEACGRGEQSAHPGAGGVRALIACSAAGASSPDLLRHFQGWDLVCPFLGGGCWAGPVWGCRGPQTSQLVPPRYQEQEPCGHVCRGHVCACVCSCVCVCGVLEAWARPRRWRPCFSIAPTLPHHSGELWLPHQGRGWGSAARSPALSTPAGPAAAGALCPLPSPTGVQLSL